MKPNGPAIKLVNVTRRPEAGEHCNLLSRKCVEAGEGGYGACFCCQAENFMEYYECRGTSVMRAICCPQLQSDLDAWRSVAVQCQIGAGFCPRLLRFLGQRRGSGFITTPVVVQRAENKCKNRDEFINFIVRVSV